MTFNFQMPPVGFGPGSQPNPEPGSELSYLPLPSGMRTFSPPAMDMQDADRIAVAEVAPLLRKVADACLMASRTGAGASFPLAGLSGSGLKLLAELMGEGEVSCVLDGEPAVKAQESVFAGVWIVRAGDADAIEVAPIPSAVAASAFRPLAPAVGPLATMGPGVVNAPALVAELMDKSRSWRAGEMPHVINLSLLPHTPADLDHIAEGCGTGSARILSRGYGNCRVTATALPNVWRVQFFNSMDTLILDTFEVTAIPEVAVAAPEDFADSAERIVEVLEATE